MPIALRRLLPVVCLLALLPLSLLAGPSALSGPAAAGAAVVRGEGFLGIVDGFRSWYGSYGLGAHGEVWCVDHGIPAPDEVLGYEPTGLEDRAPDTRRAVAWAVGRHGPGADRVTAAGLMLALHDLMGAVYPSGPLSVDRLAPSSLQGFDGHEADVLAAAQRIKGDAVAHAALAGPLALLVEAVDEVPAGRGGTLTVRLTDSVTGLPVRGAVVHPAVTGAELQGEVDRATAADGRVSWAYVAGAGPNRFELSAVVSGAELLALRPSRGVAQRVAKPAAATVTASVSFEGEVPRRLVVVKRGDAEPALPVVGARFSIAGARLPAAVEVVVGGDGRTPAVELVPGSYVVTEVAPPAGYEVAPPSMVEVAGEDVVVEVLDRARRGTLVVEKVDALTGAPVGGAAFAVRADRDGDPSTFEVEEPDWTVPLLPGRYEVREVRAPPSYRRAVDPVVAEVRAGEPTVLRLPNVPLASVAFEKRPALAGATFAVLVADVEVGRCTTSADGRCSLPADVVAAGSRVCWRELVAPAGWGIAEGACVEVTPVAGSITTVVVDEPPLPPTKTTTTIVSPPPPAPPPVAADEPGVSAARPPAPPPPAPVPPTPVPAVVSELPRTGAGGVGRWAGAGLSLIGVGLLLVGSRRGRRRPVSGRGGPSCPR